MIKLNIVAVVLLLLFLGACAHTGMDSVKKTRHLYPDMPYQEVVNLLGEPKSSDFDRDEWIVTWTLHENWKGFVPYIMTFDKNTKKLMSWKEDVEGYKASQAKLEKFAEALDESGIGGATMAVDPGPNDPGLMNWMAGYYYSYSSAGGGSSSGTERKLMLCSNGTWRMGSESGYSGGAGTSGAWGASSQGGDGGRWSINGNQQQGKITFTGSGGKKVYDFSACGNGCFYFGSIKFGYAGAPQCQ